MIHVDTSFLITLQDPVSRAARLLDTWWASGEAVGMSSIVWTEFLCGPLSAREIQLVETAFPLREPYLAADTFLAARCFNVGGRRRGSLADCLIAAVALRCGASFATLNPRDFTRFESLGLKVIDAG